MEGTGQQQDFEAVKARLDEIAEAVSDDDLPLDDALALYEEAVALGLRLSDLLEEGIGVDADEAAEPAEADAEGTQGSSEDAAPNAAEAPAAPEAE